ncbi:unnamed protein product, partial [marine sediment metagenome]
DIIATVLGYLGFALILSNKSEKVWQSTIAGLCAALAFEVHPYTAIFASTMVVLFIYKYKLDFFRKKDFWGFVAGGMIGGIIFLSLHVLPNPRTYFQLQQLMFSNTHIPPILTGNLAIISKAFIDMLIVISKLNPLVFIGILAGMKLIRSRPSYINQLVILNASLLLGFILLVRNHDAYYIIYYTPGLSLLLAAVLLEFLKSPTKSQFIYRTR